jgi:hypothetical protein
MPMPSAASSAAADVGMMPLEPTPTGMWSNSDCASCSFTCAHAGSRLSARLNRTQRAEAAAHLRDVRLDEVRAQQAHAAVDIETDTACSSNCEMSSRRDASDVQAQTRTGRHDGLGVAHVKRSDVANRKAVAAVHVGKRDGRLDDAWTTKQATRG